MTFGKMDPIYEMSLSCGAWKIISFSHIGNSLPLIYDDKMTLPFYFPDLLVERSGRGPARKGLKLHSSRGRTFDHHSSP